MPRVALPMDPAGIVRPAEDLAELARQINAEHEAGRKDMRKSLLHYRAAGERLLQAKAQCSRGTWLPWLKKNVTFTQGTAWRYMQYAKLLTVNNLDTDTDLDAAEEEWAKTRTSTGEEHDEPIPDYVTLEQWEAADKATRKWYLSAKSDKQMNAQEENLNIEWALWSWNPITGCEHNCPYCYARDMANRFYEHKFVPTLHPSRLRAPINNAFPGAKIMALEREGTPKALKKARGLQNVFVCSMADLFGRWVPAEWIEAVLDTVRKCSEWTFLFLTKFPIRMAEFDFPQNTWVGTTVDCQARVKNAEKAFRKVKAGVKWLSCEPLIEPLKFSDLGAFNWMVIGGASESSKTPEWVPPRAWVEDLKKAAKAAGCLAYEKENALVRECSYPDVPWQEPTEAPESLRYLPTTE